MGNESVGRIRRLRGVTWRWRDGLPADIEQTPEIGVIAQEVEAVFPELVRVEGRGYKTVNYGGLVAPLIEAVKELDDRLRAVEARLATLQPPDSEER